MMNRFFPLLVLLLAVPASAGDSEFGKKVFEASCAHCHTAGAAAKSKSASKTDDLALWLSQHSSAELSRWVQDPWKVKENTRCDPRQLKPQDYDDLVSYLRGANAPSTPAPTP